MRLPCYKDVNGLPENSEYDIVFLTEITNAKLKNTSLSV